MAETPASRLRQATKQIRLAQEGLEDDASAADLDEAIGLLEGVRGEIGDADDDHCPPIGSTRRG